MKVELRKWGRRRTAAGTRRQRKQIIKRDEKGRSESGIILEQQERRERE